MITCKLLRLRTTEKKQPLPANRIYTLTDKSKENKKKRKQEGSQKRPSQPERTNARKGKTLKEKL